MRYINCPNCQNQILLDSYTCSNCNNIIRDRVPNLNFFETLYLLLIDSKKAFLKIIFSEQKNYVFFLYFAFILKFSFFGLVFEHIYDITQNLKIFSIYFSINYGIIFFLFSLVLLFCFIFYRFLLDKKSKIKNIFSLLTYSTSFFSLSFIILFPIELLLFGSYLFSWNPSPFQIKPVISCFILFIESVGLIFSVYLCFSSIFFYLKSFLLPVILSLFFTIFCFFLIIYSEKLIKLIMGL